MPIYTGQTLARQLQTGDRLAANQQQQELRRLQGIMGLFTGTGNTGSNNQGASGLFQMLQQNSGQSLLQARDQAVADTQGLTSAALFDFNNSILPQITGAAEGAGASASAMTALLAQNASAAAAGQVAKNQGAQILGQEQIASQANQASQANLMQLINTLLSQTLRGSSGAARSTGGRRGSSSGGSNNSLRQLLSGLSSTGPFIGVQGSKAKTGYNRNTRGRG